MMGLFNGNLFYLLLIPEGLLLFRQAGCKAFNFREVLAPVIVGALALLALQRDGGWLTFAVELAIPALAAGAGGIISGIMAKVEKRAGGISDVSGGIWALVLPTLVFLIWLAGEFVTSGLSLSKSTLAAVILVFDVYLTVRGAVTAFRVSKQ